MHRKSYKKHSLLFGGLLQRREHVVQKRHDPYINSHEHHVRVWKQNSFTRYMTHKLMTSECENPYVNSHEQHVRLQLYYVTWFIVSCINDHEHPFRVWHDIYTCDMTHTHATWLWHELPQAAHQTSVVLRDMTHRLIHHQPGASLQSVTWLIRTWHDLYTRDKTHTWAATSSTSHSTDSVCHMNHQLIHEQLRTSLQS